jgi:hypothetical protein
MYNWQEENIKITENSKILIGLGDSFTQGHGACDINVWEKYNWDVNKMFDKYNYDVVKSGYDNSWVSQICKNYLPDYTPLNFGLSGRGNRATIKELYLHPELNIEKAKEKIVIFMMSGYERFDFVSKTYEINHHKFKTMWPNENSGNDMNTIGKEYMMNVWSEKSSLIELILNIAELQNWCKLNNAKLVLTSAFSPTINKSHIYNNILNEGDERGKVHAKSLVNIIDWSSFLFPNNFLCFTDFLCSIENKNELITTNTSWPYYEYAYTLDKMSPNGFITKCAHPSSLGHSEIAKVIYKFMEDNYYFK